MTLRDRFASQRNVSLVPILCAVFTAVGAFGAVVACKAPPKPRQVAPVGGSPVGTPARTGNEVVVSNPGGEEKTLPGPEATVTVTAEPMATATATVTAGGATTDPSTATPTTETKPTAANKVEFKAIFYGGYFRNCVSYRIPGAANWTALGCTKPEPKIAGECVGLDTAFQAKVFALPLAAAKSKQIYDVRVDTYHQDSVCDAAAGTFRYPPRGTTPVGSKHWTMTTGEVGRKTRFRCKKAVDGNETKITLGYEDAVTPNANDPEPFRDLSLTFTATGTDVGVAGFEVCSN